MGRHDPYEHTALFLSRLMAYTLRWEGTEATYMSSRDPYVLQEEFFRFQLQRNREIIAELQEMKGLLLAIGKSLIDIQAVMIDIKALAHPTALLNTLAHIHDRAAEEEARRERQAPSETPPKRTP